MFRGKRFRVGIVIGLTLVAAAVFAVAGRADDPQFGQIQSSVGPSIVDANADVLFNASWQYIDNRTLTNSTVRITVPDGWTLVLPSDPTGCSQTGRTITCPHGTIRPGDVVRQAVELRTDGDLGSQTISSLLTFYEGPSNPGRIQQKAAPDAFTTVISADPTVEPNRVGKCVGKNGGSVSTQRGVGGSDTTADVPSTDDLCTPVSIAETPRVLPGDACLTGHECTTEIVTTDAASFPTSTPIQLTITFYGSGLNSLPLIFNGGQPDEQQVPGCTGSGATPDPCYSGHTNRQRSVAWTVNWSGRDPTWTS